MKTDTDTETKDRPEASDGGGSNSSDLLSEKTTIAEVIAMAQDDLDSASEREDRIQEINSQMMELEKEKERLKRGFCWQPEWHTKLMNLIHGSIKTTDNS